MSVVIWHNPRCSKSRATLKLLEERGITPEIRRYLDEPPSETEIRDALSALGLPAIGLVRTGEADFRSLGLTKSSADADLISAMANCPKLIERPVVFSGGQARLGRPPEAELDIL